MAVRMFFDKQVVLSRMKSLGSGKRGYSTTATVDCAIQEMDRQSRAQIDVQEGRAWQGYFDIDDVIVEGDKVIDSYGTVYKVYEVTKKDYGINQYQDVVLIEYSKE